MPERFTPPEGFMVARDGTTLRITARLSCPVSEARCLAVAAASWVLDAVGGDGSILWPNRVMQKDRPVCDIGCRATADGIMFTFCPREDALSVAAEAFSERVARAAAAALAGYPDNRAALLERYCEHCVTVMKFVEVTYRGMPIHGFAFAIDKHGGLMVMTQESHTVVTVYGGEAVIAEGRDQEAPELPPMPGR